MRAADGDTQRPKSASAPRIVDQRLHTLLRQVAKGDQGAFSGVYRLIAGPVFGLVRRVLRDEAQAQEVCQEVLLEVWRTARSFDAGQGRAMTWIMTLAHRRAVDRVRAVQSAADREYRAALRDCEPAFDEVSETVEGVLEQEQVRRCLAGLTPRQRGSIMLAYYDGCTYRETAQRLGVALGAAKSRIRDGLLRLGDCLAAA